MVEHLRTVLTELIDWLKNSEHVRLKRDFTVWLRHVLIPARLPQTSLPEMTELQEMNNMLYETVQGWYREAEVRGEARGEAKLLLKLLEKKFGVINDSTRATVYHMDTKNLEACAERLLNASTLDDVLNPIIT